MKYSFNLGNYISKKYSGPELNGLLSLSPEELTEKLNSQIGALEGIEHLGTAFEGIFVAEVKEVHPHPDADKLQIVKIDDGEAALGLACDENGYIQVVCGAPNVKPGMFVAWISPGAIVPSTAKDPEPFKLATIKLRGQTSNGMLASEKELGLGDDHSGILDVREYLGLSLTPTGFRQSAPLLNGERASVLSSSEPGIWGELKSRSRENRKQSTKTEEVLWQHLRASKLGVKFRRQHAIGYYIADFFAVELNLIIEVDGGYHNSADQQALDEVRTEDLEANGSTILRFTNQQIEQNLDDVLSQIKLAIKSLSLQERDRLDLRSSLGEAIKLKPGDPLSQTLKLNDVIADFENKMFTHRPDCFGHLGIAREIAAIQGLKFKSPGWYSSSSNTNWKSYIMGLKNIDSTLARLKASSIEVNSYDKDTIQASMPTSKLNEFIDIIKDELKPGFWVDIVKSGGADTVFIFKESEELIKQFNLDSSNHDQILELCNKYAKANFININIMLAANSWYEDLFTEQADNKSGLSISLQTKACTKYRATIIEDVQVADSPSWMQTTFRNLGMTPINNLVDITNYMMILTAQPQHAFDLDKLKKLCGSNLTPSPSPDGEGGNNEVEIIVRQAEEGEELALLNGKTIKLNSADVVIATPNKAIALAGVMGGKETEVDENTKNILLETATFDMYAVRRTSMRHGLFTDAVTRYTKGQPTAQIDAIAAKTADEYKSLAHGKIGLSLSEGVKSQSAKTLHLSLENLNNVLGSNFKIEEVQEILERIEIQVKLNSSNQLELTIPFWRTDLEIEEDIIEEVGRIHGFNQIPSQLQVRQIEPAYTNQNIKLKREIRSYLAKLGANETLNYSF
ncbi:MAG: phenylalanine--tRNA ligase beta subunit-related protein, partial [Candidatus Saccharimonadales bacterium]